jgi:hypothetical protein
MIAYAMEVGDAPLLRTHLEKVQSVAPDFIPTLSYPMCQSKLAEAGGGASPSIMRG